MALTMHVDVAMSGHGFGRARCPDCGRGHGCGHGPGHGPESECFFCCVLVQPCSHPAHAHGSFGRPELCLFLAVSLATAATDALVITHT